MLAGGGSSGPLGGQDEGVAYVQREWTLHVIAGVVPDAGHFHTMETQATDNGAEKDDGTTSSGTEQG